jgi:hypothetical protein
VFVASKPEEADDTTKEEFRKLARALLNLDHEPITPAKPVQQQQQQPQKKLDQDGTEEPQAS